VQVKFLLVWVMSHIKARSTALVLLPVSSHSKRMKDDKVAEDQGKATGVDLRRENTGLELQNFFTERKTNIIYPTYRFIRISKAKETWALEVGKMNGNFFQQGLPK